MAKGRENNVTKSQAKNRQAGPIIPNIVALALAELVGTGLLLFMGCMGCVMGVNAIPIPHHLVAVSFGLTIMLIIQVFGHISGAHLNPAVTIATLLLGIMKPILGPVYIVSQFVGALLGFGLLKLLIPPEYTANEIFNPETNETIHTLGLCSTVLNPKISIMQGVALEMIITCVLILVCCAVWDKRNSTNMDSLPLRFGLIISAIAMVAGPYTGASMNTARTFAPALINGDWNNHWVYWIAPNVGAVVGTIFYKTCFGVPKDDDEDDIHEGHQLEDMPLNEKANNV